VIWWPTFPSYALAWLASLALALTPVQFTGAQTSDRPYIGVARSITARPAAQVGFPIQVGQVPRNSFVRVRGLPSAATLSEGHSIAPGVWAVPLNALPNLTITLPATAAGSAEVMVALVGPDGSALVETKCTLVVAVQPAPPPPSPYDRQRARQFLEKANEQLAQGLVASARQLYERAADLGLGEAAMALAGTYDAVELDRPHLRGVQPDAKEARRWYERARALGANEAVQRLQRLGGS
jgi:Sel1 repeat